MPDMGVADNGKFRQTRPETSYAARLRAIAKAYLCGGLHALVQGDILEQHALALAFTCGFVA